MQSTNCLPEQMSSSQLPEDLFTCNSVGGELWELYIRVRSTWEVTASDRKVLRAALFDPKTTMGEFELIDRLYCLFRQDKVRLLD